MAKQTAAEKAAAAAQRSLLIEAIPRHVKIDSRICFSIYYYDSEEKADEAGKLVRQLGYTYNGGMFDGMPCGREPSWDYTEDGKKLYAVTQ